MKMYEVKLLIKVPDEIAIQAVRNHIKSELNAACGQLHPEDPYGKIEVKTVLGFRLISQIKGTP